MSVNQAGVNRPIPHGSQARHLFLETNRRQLLAAIFLAGTLADMPLKVWLRQFLQDGLLAKRAGEVAKVHTDGGQAVVLDGADRQGLQIAVAGIAQSDGFPGDGNTIH
jgi:hypothetical protein